jgi:hypothetical protein
MPNKPVASVLLAASIIALTPSAQAKRFSSQDSDALSAISRRLGVAYIDTLQTAKALLIARSADGTECLSSIADAVNLTDEGLSATATLTFISNAMDSQTDEYVVDKFLALQIHTV